MAGQREDSDFPEDIREFPGCDHTAAVTVQPSALLKPHMEEALKI